MKRIITISLIIISLTIGSLAAQDKDKTNPQVELNSEKKTPNNFFTVYPNPNNGDFTVKFKEYGSYKIDLYNLLGNNKFTSEIINKNKIQINLNGELAKGYYMLRIKDQNGDEITRKLLIQ